MLRANSEVAEQLTSLVEDSKLLRQEDTSLVESVIMRCTVPKEFSYRLDQGDKRKIILKSDFHHSVNFQH